MQHLIVISVDAMVEQDLQLLARLPNMGKLLCQGSVVRQVETIYPSLTHPIHATLMTGCPAGVTGVPNNELFCPGRTHVPWYNRLDQVQCKTLFHAAHEGGLTTAACRWPLTAGGFDIIDHLVPEVMDDELARQPDPEKLYAPICSPHLYESVVRPNLGLLRGNEHPYDEEFSIACACRIIRNYRPNLLLTHPCMVDHTRHCCGLFNDRVEAALAMTDRWIGQLMTAVEEAGIAHCTSYAVVSDHGHLEVKREVALNVLFARKGWLRTDSEGKLLDWDVYAHSAGLSAQIYVGGGKEEEVYSALQEMAREGLYGFSQVFTREEVARRYGLGGEFAFVLETDGFTAFTGRCQGPLTAPVTNEDWRYSRSRHGHRPEVGPQPPMVVSGPAFAQGVTVEKGSILDEAPTFAAALGLHLPDAQGRPITALLAGTDMG